MRGTFDLHADAHLGLKRPAFSILLCRFIVAVLAHESSPVIRTIRASKPIPDSNGAPRLATDWRLRLGGPAAGQGDPGAAAARPRARVCVLGISRVRTGDDGPRCGRLRLGSDLAARSVRALLFRSCGCFRGRGCGFDRRPRDSADLSFSRRWLGRSRWNRASSLR